MTEHITQSYFFGRIFDAIIPILTWLIVTLPLWLSPFHPAIVAYFIIAFDLYFLYKSVTFTILATISYKKILVTNKVSFTKLIYNNVGAKQIKHFIIIPNFREPLYKLESTIQAITDTDYPFKQLFLVLAFETREKEAQEKARLLMEKFAAHFQKIFSSFHPLLPQEAPGKASNQTYASRLAERYINKMGWKQEDIIITICDADSQLPKNYFSYLTYKFISDQKRLYHFYWAPVLLYNNFWRLPFFIRMQATLQSIVRLAFLSLRENLIQISTYSTNLWLLKKINYWDVDVIPEDWHVFYQAFFKFGDEIKTIPLYTFVNGDAVYSGGILKTSQNRYEQEKRWAWGVSDISYTLKNFFTSPHIPVWSKIKRILFLVETHLLWPTSFFVLTISASIPPLINPVFKRTVLGFLLPKLSGLILTLASLMLILFIYLDLKLRKHVQIKTKLHALPFLFIQWYFLPLISFFFSSLPALEAHTRLLIGKKIKYKVTEKV